MISNRDTEFNGKINRTDIKKLIIRSFPYEHTWNYERMGNAGFCYAILPILQKLYPDKEDLAKAMTRHMELYQTNHYLLTLPLGIAAAMEEKNSEDPNFDTQSISNVKVALMGPLAGIGDAFFWGTLRVIASGVGVALAMKGSALGPILFFLIFNIPQYLSRYSLAFMGYHLGSNVIDKIMDSGLMDKIMQLASFVAMMVVGAMTMEMVNVNLTIPVGYGKEATTIQKIIDGVIPGLPSLALFGITYKMVKKNIHPLLIMLIALLLGIVGAYFGFLG